MSDFENKDLEMNPGEPSEQTEAAQGSAPGVPQEEPPYEKPTPHLTLEPDLPPDPPVYEQVQHTSPTASGAFHMPEPPRAPEPEPQSPPDYRNYQAQPQYGAPQYTQQEPRQYQPPQYNQAPVQQPYYPQQYNTPPVGYAQKSRLAAGLLAIIVGVFGVHNFYLGFNTRGTIQLIVSLAGGLLTCGVATVAVVIWAFIEGVMLLSAQPSRMYDGNGVILRD